MTDYTIDQLTADLIAFLETVGGGPVDLLGHSMGGRVVMGVAVRRPDLVHSLILMDTSAWSFMPDDDELATLAAHSWTTSTRPEACRPR